MNESKICNWISVILMEKENMDNKCKTIKNLFLQQSYWDSWEDYKRSLRKTSFIKWDYVILTASNEEQAESYRHQIEYRLEKNLLPKSIKYAVLPDPGGKRVGSGGATFGVLKYIAECEKCVSENPFKDKRILVIHSGGDSKRVPQYSTCGKLFAPVPRELPNGHTSTLFDEFIIAMSGVPRRMKEGMLVLSGDVLLLFNPLQIDFGFNGAAAISMKEPVETGKNHGVFLNDGNGYVDLFLHKQSQEKLKQLGAVNEQGNVDLDTGAIAMDSNMLNVLYSLISTNGIVDENKFNLFVNENARVSFYGDFLYPLAKGADLESYYKEAAEGDITPELLKCRSLLWEALRRFSLKLICLSPAEFIHFGTTKELLDLVTNGVDSYESIGWKHMVMTNAELEVNRAVQTSLIDDDCVIGKGTYIENSIISKNVVIGNNCVISNVDLENVLIPDNVVLNGLKLKDGSYTVRIYGVTDNPKGKLENNASFLGTTLAEFIDKNDLSITELWADSQTYLWFAKLYPVCKTMKEAVYAALDLYKLASSISEKHILLSWKNTQRTSLYDSFNNADVMAAIPRKRMLEENIQVACFLNAIRKKVCVSDALKIFGEDDVDENKYNLLMEAAESAPIEEKIRIYYYLSRYQKANKVKFAGNEYDYLESLCFESIRKEISDNLEQYTINSDDCKIAEEQVKVQLPVRVNWGGGWTDTPPYCNENGGVVLNAAIKLKGEFPICVEVKRLDELKVKFESVDIGASGEATCLEQIQNCTNPYDAFALHKAALIACGIILQDKTVDLTDLLKRIGGGIQLSTNVVNVPKGSGLGTSSILSAACAKALFKFIGKEIDDSLLYGIVMCMEQLMSTGGGWQDQVGGLTGGIKMIKTVPGIEQDINIQYLNVPKSALDELQERFVLIYSGQRRLARNLLRDVVGGYIGGRTESIEALYEMKRLASQMQFELEQGDIDAFAKLLNMHWELSKQLDRGTTNTCIEQIFLSCEDLIDARFICGAGGGGFLQVILKKGVSKKMLSERLHDVFQDSGVDVWECEFV